MEKALTKLRPDFVQRFLLSNLIPFLKTGAF